MSSTVEKETKESINHLQKAIDVLNGDFLKHLEAALTHNPCGICKQYIRHVKKQAKNIIESLREKKEVIRKGARIFSKIKEKEEITEHDIKEVATELGVEIG